MVKGDQGPVSISEKMSFRKISLSLEAAKFVFRIVRSLWNLTGTSAAVLPMCPSNFKAIQQFKVPISWLRDFTRSYEKTSLHILRRGPGWTWTDAMIETGSIFRVGSVVFTAKIHAGSINVSTPKSANVFYMYLPLYGVEVLWTIFWCTAHKPWKYAHQTQTDTCSCQSGNSWCYWFFFLLNVRAYWRRWQLGVPSMQNCLWLSYHGTYSTQGLM